MARRSRSYQRRQERRATLSVKAFSGQLIRWEPRS